MKTWSSLRILRISLTSNLLSNYWRSLDSLDIKLILFLSGPSQEGYHSKDTYCSVTFHKGYKLFCGIYVNGQSAVLQGPGSAVKLHIPEGLYGFISGHAHIDPTPFLNHIPETECLVSPIVEYNCSLTRNCGKGLFVVKVPHCLRNSTEFKNIRVHHGDIYNGVPFGEILSFTVDEKYITIKTTRFSQFICTVCSEHCYGNPKAFLFGRITPLRYLPIKSALRIYMCSPLYDILDFEQVFTGRERLIRSHSSARFCFKLSGNSN